MSSVEFALRSTRRPGSAEFCWHWRWELATLAATGTFSVLIAANFGLIALAAATGAGLAGLSTLLCWPLARMRMFALARCVVTAHRVRAGCASAWVQTRSGKLPLVLYTVPTGFGERVQLWCPAGITAADLFAARHVLAAACWAAEVRVFASFRHAHIVTLEIIRTVYRGVPGGGPPGRTARTGPTPQGWPFTRHGQAGDPDDPREPATADWWGEPTPRSG